MLEGIIADKKYKIIYADPPWNYKQSGSAKGKRGMAKWHYATMKIEDICNLPVTEISEDDAVLFLWVTCPQLSEGLNVMKAWGFEFKTIAFVWIKKTKNSKNAWGMGAWTRANAELCLLGIRPNTKAGKVVISHAVHQVIESVPGRHSEKPAEARARILQLLGDVPRIELFAREQTSGWDAWGNECSGGGTRH